MAPFLSDDELLEICNPLKQPAAMIRCLRKMGFHVKVRPNGWPLVSREHFEAVMRGDASGKGDRQPQKPQPNRAALIEFSSKKRRQ